MYKKGYIRTSSKKYDISSFNLTTHLTNRLFQATEPTFEKYETGNRISLENYKKYYNEKHKRWENFDEEIVPKIKNIVVDTFLASKDKINPNYKSN